MEVKMSMHTSMCDICNHCDSTNPATFAPTLIDVSITSPTETDAVPRAIALSLCPTCHTKWCDEALLFLQKQFSDSQKANSGFSGSERYYIFYKKSPILDPLNYTGVARRVFETNRIYTLWGDTTHADPKKAHLPVIAAGTKVWFMGKYTNKNGEFARIQIMDDEFLSGKVYDVEQHMISV